MCVYVFVKKVCPCKHMGSCLYPFFLKPEWDHTIYYFLQFAFLTVISFRIRTHWSSISFCLRAVSSAWNRLIPDIVMAYSSSPYLTATFSVMPSLAALSKSSIPSLSLLFPFPISDFFLALIIYNTFYFVYCLFPHCNVHSLVGRNLWLWHSLPSCQPL